MFKKKNEVYDGPVVWHNEHLCHYPIRNGKADLSRKLIWENDEYRYWNGHGSSHIGRYHSAEATIEAD